MIFTARRLQNACEEQNVDLHIPFVDLTKTCSTVSRDGLEIIAILGCISIVRHLGKCSE